MKRKAIYAGLFCALIGTLPGCTQDDLAEFQQEAQQGAQLTKEPILNVDFSTFSSEEKSSRVNMNPQGKMSWAPGDQVRIAYIKEVDTNDKAPQKEEKFVATSYIYEYTEEGKFVQPTTSEDRLTLPGTADNYHVIVLTEPCEPNITYHRDADGKVDHLYYQFNIAADSQQRISDPMNFTGKAHMSGHTLVKGDQETLSVNLHHDCTLMEFKIMNSTSEPFVLKSMTYRGSIIIPGGLSGIVLSGLCTYDVFNPMYVEAMTRTHYTSITLTSEPDDQQQEVSIAPGATYSVYSLVRACDFDEQTELDIKVTTDKGNFEKKYTLTQALSFQKGKWNKATVKVDGFKAEAVPLPEENPAMKQEILEQVDKNKDGVISSEEAAAITKFAINTPMTSLEGLDQLPNLKDIDFNVDMPDLTSIDLSQCKNLELVWISTATPNLEKLDITGCDKLQNVYLSSSKLKELDASNQTDLTQIWINSTGLETVNTTGCTNLDIFYVDNYTGTSLDFSTNPNLSDFWLYGKTPNLETINLAGSNNLESFQISQKTKLTDIDLSNQENLTTVNISKQNSQLAKIDLSGCKNLTSLSIPTNFRELNLTNAEKLEALYTGYTPKLESINLTGCTGMTELNLSGQKLKSLILPENAGLTTLHLNSLKNKDIVIDFNNLPKLESFTMTTVPYESLDLTPCKNLTSFTVGAGVSTVELQSLNLSGLTKLTALHIYSTNACNLESLNLDGCNALEEMIIQNATKLTSLDLSDRTKLKGLQLFRETNLSTLNLTGCNALETMTCYQTKVKTFDLSGRTKLKELDCSNNSDSTEDNFTLNLAGCTALANLNCSENLGLKSFDVSECSHLLGTDEKHPLIFSNRNQKHPVVTVWKGFLDATQSHAGCDPKPEDNPEQYKEKE